MKRMKLVDLKKIEYEEVEKPKPRKDEALIKIAKVGMCGTDILAYYGKHPHIKCPNVLGHEFSRILEAVGEGVNGIKKGSKVTVIPHLGCNICESCNQQACNYCEDLKCIGCKSTGAYAEYIVVPAKIVVTLPDRMPMEDSAFVEPASVAIMG